MTAEQQTLEQAVARFVVSYGSKDIDGATRAAMKTLIKDQFANQIGAAQLPWSQQTRKFRNPRPGKATIVGETGKVAAVEAAYINASYGHGFEYDDYFDNAHPGCCVVPAAFALGEEVGASLEETLVALVAGYETYVRIGRSGSPAVLNVGWQPHAVFANFGAAAVAAKLFRLDEQQTFHALAIALSRQAVIVENRPGANGWLAAEFAKKSAADGYTLLQTDNLHFGLQPFVIKNFPFNTHKDFEPVVPMYTTHYFVCVAANSKWNTLSDLIAAAKEANAATSALSYGSSGYASHMHLGGVMLESATGAKMKHIPYKETPQVFVSVASGDLSWAIGSPVSTEALWSAKKIKYLAITAPQRLANFPDVPTVREAGGIADYELRSWVALLAPAGVPKAVVEKINAGVARALAEPDIVERMKRIQITPWFASAAQVGEVMREDEATFSAIARKENIKVE